VLAVVFLFSFVLFGVGNAGGLSFFDYLNRNGGSSSGGATTASATDTRALLAAQAAVKKSPKDPQAWVALATAWTNRANAAGSTDAKAAVSSYQAAAKALDSAAKLKPNDLAIQKALAAAYTSEASGYQAAYQQVAQQASAVQSASPNSSQFVPSSAATALDPFTQAQQSIVSKQSSDLENQALPLYQNASDASKKALDVYLKITRLTPNDAVNWFNMAEAAQGAGDTKNAIKGYKEFLRILPGDPLAPQVKSALTQLEPKPKTSTTKTSTGSTATAPAATSTAPATTG
jgi:tetratricopeptide (TPR) repeat protein